MNTIISDKDLIPRLEPEIPKLLESLKVWNGQVNLALYFSFLLDFVRFYSGSIGERIIPFMQTLVVRILSELKKCHEKGEKNNIIINKCWNILRQIVETPAFMPNYYD